MATGIYRDDIINGLEEIPQKDIDFWCGLCQFSLESPECSKESIQICWDKVGASAGEWHRQHECPFIHLGQSCRCNDFEGIQEAFKATGLEYHK